MVIQIDIDDTIDRAVEFFRWLTQSLTGAGHTVLIVTSRTDSPENRSDTIAELTAWGITYSELVLHPDPVDLDIKELPPGLLKAHRIYIYKVIAARHYGTEILFDDCTITANLFQKYAPNVRIMQVLR